MIIREATLKDVKRIQEINARALKYDYSFTKTQEKIIKILNLSEDKLWVACTKEQVIGYIHMTNYECTYMDSLKDIMALAVDPAYQKMGAGKLLIKTAEKWAKKNNSLGIRLVSGSNRIEAHKFYLCCGYELRKEQKNFIKYFNK